MNLFATGVAQSSQIIGGWMRRLRPLVDKSIEEMSGLVEGHPVKLFMNIVDA